MKEEKDKEAVTVEETKSPKAITEISLYDIKVDTTIYEVRKIVNDKVIIEDYPYYTLSVDRDDIEIVDTLIIKSIYEGYNTFIKRDLEWERSSINLDAYDDISDEKNDRLHIQKRIRCHSEKDERVINKYIVAKAEKFNEVYTKSRFKGVKVLEDKTLKQDKVDEEYTETQLPKANKQKEIRPDYFDDEFSGMF